MSPFQWKKKSFFFFPHLNIKFVNIYYSEQTVLFPITNRKKKNKKGERDIFFPKISLFE